VCCFEVISFPLYSQYWLVHVNSSLSILWLSDHAQNNWRRGSGETINILNDILFSEPRIQLFCPWSLNQNIESELFKVQQQQQQKSTIYKDLCKIVNVVVVSVSVHLTNSLWGWDVEIFIFIYLLLLKQNYLEIYYTDFLIFPSPQRLRKPKRPSKQCKLAKH